MGLGGRVDDQLDGCDGGWVDGWMGWIGKCVDWWIDECMNWWMGGWLDVCIDVLVY